MDFKDYYFNNRTYIKRTDDRLKKIIEILKRISPSKLLDIGCGSGYLIGELSKNIDAKFYGIDVYPNQIKDCEYKIADITEGIPFNNELVDCVILGEVIEHVPNPDFILKEIYRVLKKDGYLVISTPNLVSWSNRIMVLLGIQPFFTETSSEVNLGRYFKFLGQGGKVQGHLKIFTFKSLEEILLKSNFNVLDKYGANFNFPFPISIIDTFFSRIISLSSDLIFIAKKQEF